MTKASTSTASRNGTYTTIKEEKVVLEKEFKKSKFIAIAGPISNEQSALSFLFRWGISLDQAMMANCLGTAGKPIYSAIESSGIDRVMVVVIRYFGGIKLGTGGLVRACGRVAAECLRNDQTLVVKPRVRHSLAGEFDILLEGSMSSLILQLLSVSHGNRNLL